MVTNVKDSFRLNRMISLFSVCDVIPNANVSTTVKTSDGENGRTCIRNINKSPTIFPPLY
jgi:hypothetical protein